MSLTPLLYSVYSEVPVLLCILPLTVYITDIFIHAVMYISVFSHYFVLAYPKSLNVNYSPFGYQIVQISLPKINFAHLNYTWKLMVS